MDLSTPELIAEAGVDAQYRIDKYLAKAYAAAKDLTEITEAGVALGMVQGINAKKIIAEARNAQGSIALCASSFALLHADQTAACVAAGVDLGSVTTAGGIVVGGVHTEGGGR